jgi:hypothetical protein
VESQLYEATGVDTPVLLMSVLTLVGEALLSGLIRHGGGLSRSGAGR